MPVFLPQGSRLGIWSKQSAVSLKHGPGIDVQTHQKDNECPKSCAQSYLDSRSEFDLKDSVQ